MKRLFIVLMLCLSYSLFGEIVWKDINALEVKTDNLTAMCVCDTWEEVLKVTHKKDNEIMFMEINDTGEKYPKPAYLVSFFTISDKGYKLSAVHIYYFHDTIFEHFFALL